jgi:phage-related tail fiber protein
LFAAIGTTFGVGDGSTTFNVPDLRGEFIRGWDDGRGVDTSRAFGSTQAEMIGPHNHTFSYAPSTWTVTGGPSTVNSNRDGTGTTANNSGTENRPRNIALLACIKF